MFPLQEPAHLLLSDNLDRLCIHSPPCLQHGGTTLLFAAIFKAPCPFQRASQRASIIELFKPTLYYLTPVLIAPRVILSGVKLR